MTTPSPARQAAEAYATTYKCYMAGTDITHHYRPELDFSKMSAFLAGAAWMNEQCAKETDSHMDDWGQGILERVNMGDATLEEVMPELMSHQALQRKLLKLIRALNAGSEP